MYCSFACSLTRSFARSFDRFSVCVKNQTFVLVFQNVCFKCGQVEAFSDCGLKRPDVYSCMLTFLYCVLRIQFALLRFIWDFSAFSFVYVCIVPVLLTSQNYLFIVLILLTKKETICDLKSETKWTVRKIHEPLDEIQILYSVLWVNTEIEAKTKSSVQLRWRMEILNEMKPVDLKSAWWLFYCACAKKRERINYNTENPAFV